MPINYNNINESGDIMNVSNKLKHKVINGEILTEEETNLFLKYIINKSIIITSHMYNTINYLPIYLFNEICYSYNLENTPNKYNNTYYTTIEINNKKYLVDFNFYNNKIKKLKDNKYIEYTKKTYDLYLNIIGGNHHE